MTQAVQERHELSQSSDSLADKPDRMAVIEQICSETEATAKQAAAFIDWTRSLVMRARTNGYQAHYLKPREITRYHGILNDIAPDGAVADPGSAHSMLERHLLDTERGEMGLLHDNADEYGSVQYCTVQVRYSIVR